MTEETDMRKDRVSTHRNDSTPGDIITVFGLDPMWVQLDDIYCEEGDQMDEPVAEIHVGPLNLKIFEDGIIERNGFEAHVFKVKGWRYEFPVLTWKNKDGEFTVVVCFIYNWLRSDPKVIEFDGTYADLVRHPQVAFEILGWIFDQIRPAPDFLLEYKAFDSALDTIRLILVDHSRINDYSLLDDMYGIWMADDYEFEAGLFRYLVEFEVSKEAADLLPELSQKIWEMAKEDMRLYGEPMNHKKLSQMGV